MRLNGRDYTFSRGYTLKGLPQEPVRLNNRNNQRVAQKKELPAYLQKAHAEDVTRERMAAEKLEEEKLLGLIDSQLTRIKQDRSNQYENELIADAKAYLLDRKDAMVHQGISPEKALAVAKSLDGLNHLPNDPRAPRELRTNPREGVEQRIHTQYDGVNSITGQQDISLVMDPVTGRPMITRLGKVGEGLTRADVDGYEHASEYIQQQLGRLSGIPVQANNRGNVHDPDFVANGVVIDGETTRPSWSDPAVQTHTKVMDKRSPKANKYGMAASVERGLRRTIRNNPDMNIVEAVDATPGMYGGRGRYGNDVPALLGKLYDGKKEGIIVSELSDANHQRNKAKDVYADPVEGAYYQDLDAVRKIIDSYTGDELAAALQVRPNDGHRNSYNRDPRGRVYVKPSSADAKLINQDMRDISPIVGQLFDYEY